MRPHTARAQVIAAAIVGVLAAVPVALVSEWEICVLVGWDVAVIVYLAQVWGKIHGLDADATRRLAEREDPTRRAADLMVLTAAVASLVAVGFLLGSASNTSGAGQTLRIALGLASVVLSWAGVHTVYMLRYARLYYIDEDGGIDFNHTGAPAYRDFAYLAFTLGMTFQVSDTAITDSTIRSTALRHALLSFVFSTGILATTINVVASLTRG